MSDSKERTGKVITVELANRMLPLVRAIAADLTQLSQDVSERRNRLELLMPKEDQDSSDNIYRDELREIQREVRSESQRIREYVEELRQLGLMVGEEDGTIEFPSELEGRRIMLSWKLGESELLFYRELDDDARLPLIAGSCGPGNDGATLGGLE